MPAHHTTAEPYKLHVQPVAYSLTSGTNIPPPPDSPPITPALDHRPPTPGGGPLSSHPTNSMPGAFPPTPEPEKQRPADTTMSSESNRDTTADSFQTPTSPSSAANPHDGLQDSPNTRRPARVRRLFSLSSLRQSFSSSRTSLSMNNRPGSSYAVSSYGTYNTDSTPRTTDVAPSIMSTTASTAQAPSMHSSKPSATLRKKRSSNWFKRKSGFFTMNEDGVLDVVSEDDGGSGAKRFKDSSHRLPMLPEISTLGGGELNEGSLGWDERAFRS